jgi:uncharacterized protein
MMLKHILTFAATFYCLFMLQANGLAQTNPVEDWNMKTYYMVLLTNGPARTQDSTEATRIQTAHLANIGKLFDEKKLVLAGPFLDEGIFKGIFIFDVATPEEAEKLVLSDPAVAAGRLAYEIHPWMGPVFTISKK